MSPSSWLCRKSFAFILAAGFALAPAAAGAQEPPPPAAGPAQAAPQTVGSQRAATPPEVERGGRGPGVIPEIDVYLPEGDLDLRINRLVKKVFVEGQVKYNFVDGDITAFLRYRYYGYSRTYQLTVFDDVTFEGVEEFSSDFSRTRGLLLLTQWPHSYHRRAFLLTELDLLSSNKEELVFNDDRVNSFVRLGYQIGTPQDERSNAIVGEERARIEQLFSGFRDIGPGDAGLTGALTHGFDFALGDFDYVKLEFSGLKRFELPGDLFLIGRLQGGTFLHDEVIRDDPELDIQDRLSIPRAEFFRLDGRDNLKGLKQGLRGTEKLQTTWELGIPWFLHEDREKFKLHWQNWYWVLYGGYGTVAFDSADITDLDRYLTDVGIGFESSFRFRKYEFFLGALVAQALDTDDSAKARISIKSYH